MHAAGNVNGELRARVGGRAARLHVGLHEVPVTYVVVLRESGAPVLRRRAARRRRARPLARAPARRRRPPRRRRDSCSPASTRPCTPKAGHEMATSVEEVRVRDVEPGGPGTAGRSAPTRSPDTARSAAPGPTSGGAWSVVEGDLVRGDGGVAAMEQSAEALLDLPVARRPPARADPDRPDLRRDGMGGAALALRRRRARRLAGTGLERPRHRSRSPRAVAGRWWPRAPSTCRPRTVSSLQVVDDGGTIGGAPRRAAAVRPLDRRRAPRGRCPRRSWRPGPADRATLRGLRGPPPLRRRCRPSSTWAPPGTSRARSWPWRTTSPVPPASSRRRTGPRRPRGRPAVGAEPRPRPARADRGGIAAGPGRPPPPEPRPHALHGRLGRSRLRRPRGRPAAAGHGPQPGPGQPRRAGGLAGRRQLRRWSTSGSTTPPTHNGSAVSLFCSAGGHERIGQRGVGPTSGAR